MSLYDVCNDAGGMTAYEWGRDPKRLAFILARYQFVARMLKGKDSVLEIGCSDAFGTRLVMEEVREMWCCDVDEAALKIAQRHNQDYYGRMRFSLGDPRTSEMNKWAFSAIYMLDVLEHLGGEDGNGLVEWMSRHAPVAVIGSPSLESQVYASELSKKGHINCGTEESLRGYLLKYWPHVFMFGMNDTTLHTGFGPMCHYRFAVCVR